MFSLGSKSLFGLGVAALLAGIVYFFYVTNEEALGSTLLFLVGLAAIVLGLIVVWGAGPDHAPRTAVDATVVHNTPPGGRPMFPSVWPLGLGIAVAVLAVGAATDFVVFVPGLAIAVLVLLGWLFQAWTEHPRFTARFGSRLSDRLLVPLGLPVAVAFLVLVIAVSLSRVLLATTEQGSRAVALTVAVVVLAGAFFVASQERMARAALSVLCGVALAAVVAAGAVGLAHGSRQFEKNKNASHALKPFVPIYDRPVALPGEATGGAAGGAFAGTIPPTPATVSTTTTSAPATTTTTAQQVTAGMATTAGGAPAGP